MKIKTKVSLVFRPIPKIYKALEKNKKYTVVYGGTRAGKTYTILQYIVYHALNRSFNSCSIVSATFPHLRKGAMQDFLDIIQPFYHKVRHNKSHSTFIFPNGAMIRFFSVDAEHKVRGIKQDWCFINEVNNIDESRFFQLLMRSKRMIVDFNPVSRFWLDDFIEKQNEDDVVIVKATYKDNPHLSDDEIKSIEALRHNALFWRIYGEGERGDVTGKAFTNYEIVEDDILANLGGRPILGLDLGFMASATALIAIWQVDDHEIIASELLYEKGAALEKVVATCKAMDYEALVVDSAHADIIRLLKEANLPSVIPSYKMELRASYMLLNRYHIKITKSSTNLIKEAQNLLWKDDKNLEGSDHAIDALRYAVHKVHFLYR